MRSTIEVVLSSGQKLQFDSVVSLLMQRPNKLRAERRGDLVDQIFFYDGTSLTLFNPKENLYATVAAPGTIEEMLDLSGCYVRQYIGSRHRAPSRKCSTTPGSIDPQAEKLLRASTSFLATQKQFSVDSPSTSSRPPATSCIWGCAIAGRGGTAAKTRTSAASRAPRPCFPRFNTMIPPCFLNSPLARPIARFGCK